MTKGSVLNSNISNVYPLSPLQKGMLYHYISNKETNDYIVQNVFNVIGNINKQCINQALQLLQMRYDVLRTRIVFEKINEPMQVVGKKADLSVEWHSFAGLSEKDQKTKLENILRSDVQRGFDLQRELMVKIRVIQYSEREIKMVWNYHHIIVDGWSISLVYDSFLKYYDLLVDGVCYEDVEELVNKERMEGEYIDYIYWITNHDQTADINYWKELLCDYDGTTEISAKRKNDYSDSFTERLEGIKLSKEETKKITLLIEKFHLTFNTVVEAIWGVYLQKLNYSDDVVFGKVISGRNVPVEGISKIAGLIINTIPARIKCGKSMVLLDLFRQVQSQGVESNEHCCCSLADIQRLTKQKNGLINNIFVFENFGYNESAWKRKHIELQAESYREQTNYPISAIASVEDGLLNFSIRYDPQIFDAAFIRKILETFKMMLCFAVENPFAQVSQVPTALPEEKQEILREFGTGKSVSLLETTIGRFEKHVRLNGGAAAVCCGNKSFTYAEINDLANRTSKHLIKFGVKQNDLVAILCSRGPEMIFGILGILKTGAGYVPIDPELPSNRISYLLKESGAEILLTDKNLAIDNLEKEISVIELAGIYDMLPEVNNPQADVSDHNIAYCIFTSGTTGNPKGVMIERRSLDNYINYAASHYVTKQPVVPLFSNFAFDLTITSIFLPLVCGGKLKIYPNNVIDSLTDIFSDDEITFVKLTPSHLKIAISVSLSGIRSNLETMILGGEALTTSDSMTCLEKFGAHIKIHNEYGPTEATVGCCDHIFDPDYDIGSTVSIGRSIDNTKIYVLNKNEVCAVGMIGELCIGGIGVAKGYKGDRALNDEKFVTNPFGEGLIYRSGDLARWGNDGFLEYIGRIDDQIKVRGYRIEPNEIVKAVCSVDFVTGAVITLEDDDGDRFVNVYYTAVEKVSEDKVREFIKNHLPAYMIPARMMQIDKIPVTSNGKIDKEALPKINVPANEILLTGNEYETNIMSIWSKILKNNKVGIHDNFFDIGGNSLLIIKMLNHLDVIYPGLCNVGDIFANPTVHQLALYIERLKSGYLICEELPFVESFYKKIGSDNRQTYFYTIDGAESEVILKSMENSVHKAYEIFMFVFCYLLNGYTLKGDTTVCSYCNQSYTVIGLSEEDYRDLNMFPGIILKKYENTVKYKNPVIRRITKRNGLLPVFLFLNDDNEEYKMFADFALSVNIEGCSIVVSVETLDKRVPSHSAKRLAEQYVTMLKEVF